MRVSSPTSCQQHHQCEQQHQQHHHLHQPGVEVVEAARILAKDQVTHDNTTMNSNVKEATTAVKSAVQKFVMFCSSGWGMTARIS